MAHVTVQSSSNATMHVTYAEQALTDDDRRQLASALYQMQRPSADFWQVEFDTYTGEPRILPLTGDDGY